MSLKRRVACVGLALALLSTVASAHIIVHFDPIVQTVAEGDSVTFDIVADISDPIVGWGLDVSVSDASVASIVPPPTIGPLWDAVSSPDGDDLAGLSLTGISGDDVLLATITVAGLNEGTAWLQIGVTGSDLTEGFALDPDGFDSWTACTGLVNVVIPEPASLALLGLTGIALFRRR